MPGAGKDSPSPVGHAGAGATPSLGGSGRTGEGGLGQPERRGRQSSGGPGGRGREEGSQQKDRAALPPRAAGVSTPLAAGNRNSVLTEGERGAPASARRPCQPSQGFRGPSTLTLPAGRARALHRLERFCLIPRSASQLPSDHAGPRDPQGPRKTESPRTPYDPQTVAPQAPLSLGFSRPRIPEWVAMSFSRGSSSPRDGTWVSLIAGRLFYLLSHQESPGTQESLPFKGYPPQVSPTPPGCRSPGLSTEGPRGRSAFQLAQPTPHNPWGLSLELGSFGC